MHFQSSFLPASWKIEDHSKFSENARVHRFLLHSTINNCSTLEHQPYQKWSVFRRLLSTYRHKNHSTEHYYCFHFNTCFKTVEFCISVENFVEPVSQLHGAENLLLYCNDNIFIYTIFARNMCDWGTLRIRVRIGFHKKKIAQQIPSAILKFHFWLNIAAITALNLWNFTQNRYIR